MQSAASFRPLPLGEQTPELAALSDATLDALFLPATRIETVSAWWGHVPFAFWLLNVTQPRLFVELGTHSGVSYSAFCEAVVRERTETRCFAVDTWRGDEHSGFYDESVYSDFRIFHDERYSSFSTILRSTFDDAVSSFNDGSIDLLHIDGLHTREAVEHDFKIWAPKLSDKCVVLIHDTNEREGNFGVWRFWAELAGKIPTFEFLHGHGLGVASVGSEVPQAVASLCSVTDPATRVRIRERFSFTGERWIANMRERHVHRELVERDGKLEEKDRELSERDKALGEKDRELRERDGELRERTAKVLELSRSLESLGQETEANRLTQIERETQIEEARNRVEAELKKAEAEIEREREKTATWQRKIRTEAVARIELKEKLTGTNARLRQERDQARAEAAQVRRELEAEAARRVVSEAVRIRQAGDLQRVQAATAPSTPVHVPRTFREYVHLISLIASLRLRQFRTEREIRHTSDVIRNSSMFDAAWYKQEYPDVAESGIDPASHFVTHGASEGRNPSLAFNTTWYLQNYPDVAAAGGNPLQHYLMFGAAEGRATRPIEVETVVDPQTHELFQKLQMLAGSPLFDVGWYLEQNPDVAQSGINPLLHYLSTGAAEGRNPGPCFDGNRYLQRYPEVAAASLNPLLHYIEWGAQEGREPQPVFFTREGKPLISSVDQIEKSRYPELKGIPVYLLPKGSPRITMVTDSINSGSLFGGVGTALIFSALLAQRIGADLRLLTRLQTPELDNFKDVLDTNGITWEGNIERACLSDAGIKRDVSISDQDVFLTTSWWATRSVAGAVNKRHVFYLLQEDERMFYPFGDRRLRCQETLADPDLRFIVNSELLFRHLTTGADGFDNIRESGTYFEPAFPSSQYFPEEAAEKAGSKNNFFFYARPDNLRNLYWRGLEAVSASVEEGVLTPEKWDFYFVGRSIGDVVLPGNVRPKIVENMSWAQYGALVRRMDLGLSLMDTPHPSYPPLDLAASGAVVVTNRHGIKTSLTQYSPNILCSDSTVEGLKGALREGARLAENPTVRFANYSKNKLCRDWAIALEPVLEWTAKGISKGNA